MKTNPDQVIRQHLLYLLKDGGAHAKFDDVIKNFPSTQRGEKVQNFPHTAWMLLEHMRIAQWDIFEFGLNRDHASPTCREAFCLAANPLSVSAFGRKSSRGSSKTGKARQTLVGT